MKKNTVFCIAFLLGVLMAASCSSNSQVSVYDGELQWPSIASARITSGTNANGDVGIWAPFLQTEIGNSLRGISFMINTCEPGTYSGVYNAATEKWSTPAITYITMNVDYDGAPYPTWRGQSATLTIHSYNKSTKRIDATLDAVMLMDGSSNTRNIRVEMTSMNVIGK